MTDPPHRGINPAGEPTDLQAGGHLSSADLFRQYARFVASFLLRMGISRADLDDVMQDVFLVAHRLGGYNPGPAKPTTFLANIALRAATSHRRKGQVRAFVRPNDELVSSASDGVGDPERTAEQRQQLELLQLALDRLDDDKRAVFVMAELQGETVVSIAAGLGIAVDTAYSRLRAARRIFHEAAVELLGDAANATSSAPARPNLRAVK
jgi:RNA polymerase sigma-70 factor (ECF subfamily)